jgi:hypothetical protein
LLLMALGTIFPTVEAGGVQVRDPNGYEIIPPLAEKAYPPLPPFVVTPCDYLALPSDCTARIEAKQINAIVSEMVALAECWMPGGPWDCNSLQNLCVAFRSMGLGGIIFDQVSIIGSGTEADPHRVGLVDCGSY